MQYVVQGAGKIGVVSMDKATVVKPYDEAHDVTRDAPTIAPITSSTKPSRAPFTSFSRGTCTGQISKSTALRRTKS